MTYFNELTFERQRETSIETEKSRWGFFIPGVNSGAYKPASLHINVRVWRNVAGFFRLKKLFAYTDITLTGNEFDQLFEEMQKIKFLRDHGLGDYSSLKAKVEELWPNK